MLNSFLGVFGRFHLCLDEEDSAGLSIELPEGHARVRDELRRGRHASLPGADSDVHVAADKN